MIKRYDFKNGDFDCEIDGVYVDYDDYKKLEKDNRELTKFKKNFDDCYNYYLEQININATPDLCAVASVLFGIKEEGFVEVVPYDKDSLRADGFGFNKGLG